MGLLLFVKQFCVSFLSPFFLLIFFHLLCVCSQTRIFSSSLPLFSMFALSRWNGFCCKFDDLFAFSSSFVCFFSVRFHLTHTFFDFFHQHLFALCLNIWWFSIFVVNRTRIYKQADRAENFTATRRLVGEFSSRATCASKTMSIPWAIVLSTLRESNK